MSEESNVYSIDCFSVMDTMLIEQVTTAEELYESLLEALEDPYKLNDEIVLCMEKLYDSEKELIPGYRKQVA
ncbi:hypothetical protein [Enterococcus faecalis]|uniref:hypothetical protein n=1 Tax=Enterococcus faecalis TaxID=1351 RepID=UPI0025B1660A|nr:hypothetical protein [Enterococcus faecalis]MDN3185238.1 hypothetical protein [Enterococcus faecalis]